jgi:two-component system cell cycle response regulator DivK
MLAKMATILYIDDTENNRILVSRRLERKGYDVLTAVSAEEGLALAKQKAPDLILMDMGMPDVDGWTATRQLKADPRLGTIPVIALTAHAMQGDREKALDAGCDDYETKPFDFPRLFEKIEARLAARKSPS